MHGCVVTPARMAAALVALCALAAMIVAWAPSHAAAASPSATAESALITEMNAARASFGRPPLRRIATLMRPARAHSRYLFTSGEFTHDGRDGAPFSARLLKAGFPRGHRMGENIARMPTCGSEAARQTVDAWLASPPHRANLLDKRFRWVGVGAAGADDCSTTVLTADYGG